MSVRDITFRGLQGDRKIDPRPEYWYAKALLNFIAREHIDPDADNLICLCTDEDAAALAGKLPANQRVRITTPTAANWNGKLKPLTFYVGIMPDERATHAYQTLPESYVESEDRHV